MSESLNVIFRLDLGGGVRPVGGSPAFIETAIFGIFLFDMLESTTNASFAQHSRVKAVFFEDVFGIDSFHIFGVKDFFKGLPEDQGRAAYAIHIRVLTQRCNLLLSKKFSAHVDSPWLYWI